MPLHHPYEADPEGERSRSQKYLPCQILSSRVQNQIITARNVRMKALTMIARSFTAYAFAGNGTDLSGSLFAPMVGWPS